MASKRRLCGGIAYNRNALKWDASCLSPDKIVERDASFFSLFWPALMPCALLEITPLTWHGTWALDCVCCSVVCLLGLDDLLVVQNRCAR